MKRILKTFGILIFVSIIALTMLTCDMDEDTGSGAYSTLQPFDDINAVKLVAGIKLGWNLGNTLDAAGDWMKGQSVSAMETAWISPKIQTTQANINALRNGGFNAIRIPVSWTKACDANFNIRKDWMKRVTEIVNYADNAGLYIILNTHHDENVFKFENNNAAAGRAAFRKIWGQIADNFKNYNEKLIFEGLNEPRTQGSSAEWSGGTAAERTNLNSYYQDFVDVVRASGGNNDKRFLLINAYAASVEASAMNALVLPTDIAANKLIVSFHSYSPYNFALDTNPANNTWSSSNSNDTNSITQPMDNYRTKFINNGIPVIIGEFGAMNKNNESTRVQWATYYITQAKNRGMPCFWWDNAGTSGDGELFGLINRSNNTWVYPALKDAMVNAAN